MGAAETRDDYWGRASADWAALNEPNEVALWEAMLAAMEVGPGTRFLDAGCGAGGASERAIGRGARASGIDASEGMIAYARNRLPDADFRVGDLQSLPYEDDSFDAVMSANAVQFAADPVAALGELRRVCAPGAKVTVATWDEEDKSDHRFLIRALTPFMPAPPAGAPRPPGMFGLGPPGELEAFLARAGFRVIGGERVPITFVYADREAAWRAQLSTGPVQRAIRDVDESALMAALDRVYPRFETADGELRLNNVFRFVVALP